jgi:UDP-glucose 4-epimerase
MESDAPMSTSRPVSRCLVLGGAGFLGSHIVETLAAEGIAVRVFDRVARRVDAPAAVEWIEGDFGNRGDVAAAIAGCDVAIHLVATTLPKTSNDDPIHDLESNLLPTVRFLDLARDGGLRRVVFASSGGTVYGVPEAVPISETHPTRPLCSYGIHKLAIEQYLHLYHTLHGLEYCVLRLANPFGERQRPDASQGAVTVFLDKALRGEAITVWGDGSAIRDYVYVGDVARAFHLAVTRPETRGLFNIGSGSGMSVLQLLAAIERLLGRPVARHHERGRAFDVPANVLDISLAARALRWAPVVTFEAGLQRMLEHMQSAHARPVGAAGRGERL